LRDIAGEARRLYVYILACLRRALYIGVTNDILRRLQEHREATPGSHSARYKTFSLVYLEAGEDPVVAIEREKQLKGWRRSKKVALIEGTNPQWRDISLDFDGY
jgi:putative endonuclease